MKTFQEEQNSLLELILNAKWFKKWSLNEPHEKALEFYLTQKITVDQAIQNIKLVFNWLLSKKYLNLQVLKLTVNNNISEELLFETILSYIKLGFVINKIYINCDGSFLNSDDRKQAINNYINSFKKVNCELIYNFVIDTQVNDSVFSFAKQNNCIFSPSVTTTNINNWEQTLNWWIDKCKQNNLEFLDHVFINETLSNDWSDEDTNKLLNLYKANLAYVKDHYKLTDNAEVDNKKAFIDVVFFNKKIGGLNIALFRGRVDKVESDCLTIDLNTLIFGLRDILANDTTAYGKFEVQDGAIIGLEAKNINTAIKLLTSDLKHSIINCDTCDQNTICCQQRLNICKEYTKDLFVVNQNLCDTLKSIQNFLLEEYEKLGIFDEYFILTTKDSKQYPIKKYNQVFTLLKLKKIKESL